MKTLVFIIILGLTLWSCHPTKPTPSNLVLKLSYGEESMTLDSQNKISNLWQEIEIKDPQSGMMIKYEGYPAGPFFKYVSEKWKIDKIDHIQTEALDGYKVNFPLENINNKHSFLALMINNLPEQGFYNKDIKAYHDWKPSYLLLGHPNDKLFGSSPYQVHKIKIFDKKNDADFLIKFPPDYRAGAQVFMKKCSKCHIHEGFGGRKAPPIALMTTRWPSDKMLRKFLADPQKFAKRRFEMSAYEGTEEELDQLIHFLRFIEKKL